MPSVYKTVQRRRFISQQNGDSFQRLESGERSEKETESQSRRCTDSIGRKD